MHKTKFHGIGHTHEYNWNCCGCQLECYGRLRSRSDEQLGTKSNHIGDRSCESIRGLGKAILDDEIFSLDPAEGSQRIKKHKLGLIKGFPASISYSKKAEPTAFCLRARITRRNKQRRGARNEFPSLHSILMRA